MTKTTGLPEALASPGEDTGGSARISSGRSRPACDRPNDSTRTSGEARWSAVMKAVTSSYRLVST